MQRLIFDLDIGQSCEIFALTQDELPRIRDGDPFAVTNGSVQLVPSETSIRLAVKFENESGGALVFPISAAKLGGARVVGFHFSGRSDERIVAIPSIYAVVDGVVQGKVQMRGMVVDQKSWSFSEAAHFHKDFGDEVAYYLELSFLGLGCNLDVERLLIW